MFVDTAKVFIRAGKGGNGAVSFRREIYIPKGARMAGTAARVAMWCSWRVKIAIR